MHAPARPRMSHLLAAAAVLATLLPPGQDAAASTHPVTVGGSGSPTSPYLYRGVPASVTAGDTVTWLNQTTANHTVTPTLTPDAGFRSHDLNGQGSYGEYLFTVPGGYAFHCRNHPDTMHATLTVNPAPSPSPTPSPPPAAVPAPRPAPTSPVTARAAVVSPTAAPPSPSRSATPRPTATPAPPVAATQTPSSDAEVETETETATTSGSILPTAPQPPLTAAPAADHGGPSPPVALGLLALMVALAAGALALRRRG
jgi:plastocyanin